MYRRDFLKIIPTALPSVRSALSAEVGLAPGAARLGNDEFIARAIQIETDLLARFQSEKPEDRLTPLAEIKIQELAPREAGGRVESTADVTGRFRVQNGRLAFTRLDTRAGARLAGKSPFLDLGFVQLALIDNGGIDRERYDFEYLNDDLLRKVRCRVFRVGPKAGMTSGLFQGRVWIAERDCAIVRFTGSYTSLRKRSEYVHFNSIRANAGPGLWVPASTFIEEQESAPRGNRIGRFKASVEFWGYQSSAVREAQEQGTITVEEGEVNSTSENDTGAAPIEEWRHESQKNLIDWMQKRGFLSGASSPAERDMEAMVNNLLVESDIDYPFPIRCKVLLTGRLESFAYNNAIAASRTLIDALNDQSTLALILARELACILLGYSTDTTYAFAARTMGDEKRILENMRLHRKPEEMMSADLKAIEIMSKSRYSDKLASAALFVRAVAEASATMQSQFRPLFGNPAPGYDATPAMARFMQLAPPLVYSDLKQIAALPLSSRVRVDPWSNLVELHSPPQRLIRNPAEKMAFEVSPAVLDSKPVDGPARSDLLAWLSAPRFFSPAEPAIR